MNQKPIKEVEEIKQDEGSGMDEFIATIFFVHILYNFPREFELWQELDCPQFHTSGTWPSKAYQHLDTQLVVQDQIPAFVLRQHSARVFQVS